MIHLYLCTTLRRDGYDYDVVIYFRCISYRPGCAVQIYGDPSQCYPAEPAEAEFEFLRAEFDGPEPADAPGPITVVETAALWAWFEEHEDEALDAYVAQTPDPGAEADDADRAYDRRKDEKMERAR